MIGEVNAITGMYIRAMGVHSWNTGIAAVWDAVIFERSLWFRMAEEEHIMASVDEFFECLGSVSGRRAVSCVDLRLSVG